MREFADCKTDFKREPARQDPNTLQNHPGNGVFDISPYRAPLSDRPLSGVTCGFPVVIYNCMTQGGTKLALDAGGCQFGKSAVGSSLKCDISLSELPTAY